MPSSRRAIHISTSVNSSVITSVVKKPSAAAGVLPSTTATSALPSCISPVTISASASDFHTLSRMPSGVAALTYPSAARDSRLPRQ